MLWADRHGGSVGHFPLGPRWASGCVKPLTTYSGGWTRGSSWYQGPQGDTVMALDIPENSRVKEAPTLARVLSLVSGWSIGRSSDGRLGTAS